MLQTPNRKVSTQSNWIILLKRKHKFENDLQLGNLWVTEVEYDTLIVH
jgi:hypothetical protein